MSARAEVRTAVTVDKPVEQVYDYIVDLTKHGEWSPKPYRVEDLNEPVHEGTTYTSYGWIPGDKDHRNDVTVTELHRPDRIVLTSTEQGEQFVNTFTLTAEAGGTKVERVIDMPKPKGFAGMMLPVLIPTFIKPAVGKGLKMLKQKVER
jgi:uncharacterized protein YndB with AHSA1/START domain